ncbi:unnamed protein product [Lathyrus sativus]|nr:unnamed protein product [Lathyrus sativus]
MSSSIPVHASSSTPPKVQKNVPGSITDIAWKHGVSVDGGTRKIRCNYCSKEVIGGVYRLKHHLACTQINVGACKSVHDDVKFQMWQILKSLQNNLLKKTEDTNEIVTGKRPLEDDDNVAPAKKIYEEGHEYAIHHQLHLQKEFERRNMS